MELRILNTFLKVAQLQSFSKAAASILQSRTRPTIPQHQAMFHLKKTKQAQEVNSVAVWMTYAALQLICAGPAGAFSWYTNRNGSLKH